MATHVPSMPDDLRAASAKMVSRAKSAGKAAGLRAMALDHDGAFPEEDMRGLSEGGLLAAPFPAAMGGDALGIGDAPRLGAVLAALGRGSLALGRLYEGHVNAVALAVRYGSAANLSLLKAEADAGRASGVWMAGAPLRLERRGGHRVLRGGKILCSGAGRFRRPLVAAETEDGSVMLLPRVDEPWRVDISAWTAQGMRATATGSVDFEGIRVEDEEIIGRPGDYLRSPYFRGGAWRVLAVQLGGLEAVLDAYRTQLRESPHREHPLQLARYGGAEIACETARLWVRQAGATAEGAFDDAAAVDAYVDLARNAFEAAALDVIERARKAIGLKALVRPNPLERLVRDLSTYLRQPALDMSLMSAAAYRLRPPSDDPA